MNALKWFCHPLEAEAISEKDPKGGVVGRLVYITVFVVRNGVGQRESSSFCIQELDGLSFSDICLRLYKGTRVFSLKSSSGFEKSHNCRANDVFARPAYMTRRLPTNGINSEHTTRSRQKRDRFRELWTVTAHIRLDIERKRSIGHGRNTFMKNTIMKDTC